MKYRTRANEQAFISKLRASSDFAQISQIDVWSFAQCCYWPGGQMARIVKKPGRKSAV
jgi:hypothetical protein